MKPDNRPNTLSNAPLQYAPENELGVVYFFAHIARKLQYRVERVRQEFPDCIAYKRAGDSEKRVRIEFELKSGNFKAHKHDPRKCDCIVCWHNDWPDHPSNLEIIELKRYFGVAPKVWIQPALKSQWHWLDDNDNLRWSLSKRVTHGDLLLMYRCHPEKSIREIFVLQGGLAKGKASWREGDAYFGRIIRLCDLGSPIFLEDMQRHKVLQTSPFVRRNMQGNHLVSEYWSYLYEMIIARNPKLKLLLRDYAPEKL